MSDHFPLGVILLGALIGTTSAAFVRQALIRWERRDDRPGHR